MNDNHGNPARLRDRHDQPDLVERIAGQAARDLREPPQLSASALARIAARIDERTGKPRALRLGPVLVAASVLLGVVTVASAARMDLLPRWMAKMVGLDRQPISNTSAPLPRKTRHVSPKIETPLPAEPATAPKQEMPAEMLPAPMKGPSAGIPIPEAEAAAPREQLAMVEVSKGPRGLGQRQPTPQAPKRLAGAHRDDSRTLAPDVTMSSPRLAMRGPTDNTARPPLAPSPPLVLPPTQPSPILPDRPAPLATAPAPSERPVPPALPPPAQAQTPPAPAPAVAPARAPAARHLKDVVHALRVEHAPGTALDLLDRHAQELAGNAFAEEALLLRVEAMLALKRQPEVLRLLDGMSLANAASSSVLLVTRGQLRANANRCAEAVTDFDLALARAYRPSKQALLGRAQCKQKLGDRPGAEADLDRLHREFR